MESSASFMMKLKNRSAKLSRHHLELAKLRRSVISTNHLWIPMQSRPVAFHQSSMTWRPLMALPIFKNLSPSWLDLKCAVSAESLGQLSIPMRWIPIPIFSTSVRAGYHCLMSLTTAKNSSRLSAPLSSITSPRCVHWSVLQMAQM